LDGHKVRAVYDGGHAVEAAMAFTPHLTPWRSMCRWWLACRYP